ncbi:J domain-containing protein [Nonomuraea polychroma]|uniref:J domain-containing protein n=1 Tax=Nonomuraea polychroma TaxID=46176 RepID=UPI0019D49860|nr:J domain-containing protein [Nonomuraea polychroma]
MPTPYDATWPRRDHYMVLGVEPSASTAQITSAYRRLVRVLHPDARPAGPAARDRFAEVVDAYAVLRDPARRAAYDAEFGRAAPDAVSGRPVPVKVTRTPSPDTGVPSAAGRRRTLADVLGLGMTIDPFPDVGPRAHVLLRVGPSRLSPSRRDRHDMPLLGYDTPWGTAHVWLL